MAKKDKSVKKVGVPRRSIFRRVLRPLSLLAILDAFMLVMVLQAAGVLRQLDQNSFDIFKKQVDNRQSYLQSQMTGRWMQLEELAASIGNRVLALEKAGELSLEDLDSSAKCAPLILDVVDSLISQLYARQVSGIFLVFNTQDLRQAVQEGDYREKVGIYIRDNDPFSLPSDKYADLLLECAPGSVVQSLALSTASDWEARFQFSADHPYGQWLTEPYTVAAESHGKLGTSDCGLWSLRQNAQGETALVYSIPLILSDGRVCGVLGVDLLPSYLATQMPTAELDEKGVYGLLMTTEQPGDL